MTRTTPEVTLRKILKYDPCSTGYRRLTQHLNEISRRGTWGLDKPFKITEILREPSDPLWLKQSDFIWLLACVRLPSATLQRDLINIIMLCTRGYYDLLLAGYSVRRFVGYAKDFLASYRIGSYNGFCYENLAEYRTNMLTAISPANQDDKDDKDASQVLSVYQESASIITDIVISTCRRSTERRAWSAGQSLCLRTIRLIRDCGFSNAGFSSIIDNYYT